MNIEKLRKYIFQCRLTGDTIVLGLSDTSGKERHEVRRLLFETGVIVLRVPDFFEKNPDEIHAKAAWTHTVEIVNCGEITLLPKGSKFSISRGAYKLLISGKEGQVADFIGNSVPRITKNMV